jgi:hypothetical protein
VVTSLERHYARVSGLIAEGEVIPFLGAGANLCDRPDGVPWERGRYLPSGAELAEVLAANSHYPLEGDHDLLRVSQYVDAVLGEKDLYRYVRAVLDADYAPSSLHRFLAGLPALLREHAAPPLLVLTTNYDDALERALDEREEPYDVVWYEAKRGSEQGKFVHRPPGGDDVVIERPNEYAELDARTVILKLHGAVHRANPKRDSYVITEDDYVGYLSRGDVGGEIPVTLRERLADSHFLFLGYSMRDWNLRVILNRIWGEQQLTVKSWAVQREPADPAVREIEETLWRDRGDVDLVYALLSEYVSGLATELSAASADA